MALLWKNSLILFFYFILGNRRRFFTDDMLDLSISTRKEELLRIVKLIGREYSCLTALMEKINICYSFQVSYRNFWSNISYISNENHIYILFLFTYFVLVDDQYGNHILTIRFHILHILSIFFSTKWWIQRDVTDLLPMGSILSFLYYSYYLFSEFGYLRGKFFTITLSLLLKWGISMFVFTFYYREKELPKYYTI